MYLLYILLLTVPTVLSGPCTFDTSSPKSPFIALEDYTFPLTFKFEEEESFLVACPKNTYSPYLSEKGDKFVCKNNTSILNVRTVKIIDFKDIVCNEAPETTVRRLKESCALNGTRLEIGVEVYKDFIPAISCCFNEDKLMVVYCQGKLKGNVWSRYELEKCSYDFSTFPCVFFDSSRLYSGIVMDELYKNQLEMFSNKGIEVTDVYIPFPLVIYRFVSQSNQIIQSYPARDYINVVPFRNSSDFSSYVQLYIANSQPTSVFVGTLGVASAKNRDSKLVELFLGDDQIPIPEWIWIITNAVSTPSQVRLFYNGVGNEEEAQEAISHVCDEYEYIWASKKFIFKCQFESVINSDLKQMIENELCPDLGCPL